MDYLIDTTTKISLLQGL